MSSDKLDETKPYATVHGSSLMRYEQGGLMYDHHKRLIGTPKTVAVKKSVEEKLVTDKVDHARAFLRNVLSGGPLAKSVVYRVAGDNNQEWEHVKEAAQVLGIVTYKVSDTEMWKLNPEMANGVAA